MNQAAATAPSTRKLMKMAEAAMSKQRGAEAMNLLEQVVALNPGQAEAWYKMGLIMNACGQANRARAYLERAIAADASHAESYLLMAMILESENNGLEALKLVIHTALNVAPNNVDVHTAVASTMLRQQNSHMVVPYLENVLPRFPDSLDLYEFYVMGLKVAYRFEEANAIYAGMRKKWRVRPAFRIMFETFLPRLNFTTEQIDQMREEMARALDQFMNEKLHVKASELTYNPLFVLAYHNRDNKELLQHYNRMLRKVVPELSYTAPYVKNDPAPGEKIRIGFVSAHMHDHSVGRCYRRTMLHLAEQPEFEVVFFNLSHVMDAGIQQIIDANVPICHMPKHIASAREMVESFKPHILIYPDIGMHVPTQYLAMSRLAKYQACFQGHPETTGIDTVDYVISSRSYEPPHADENYTERLLCNEGVDTMFKRQMPPQRWMTRQELGLPTDKKLYVCPMAIQKFHPDFDKLLGDIQTRDPNAVLVLFRDFDQVWASELLQNRILSHCDPERVIFMEWQPLDNLFSILKEADAILDTIYFGGGTTAQYAYGFGLPIVTMPGRYARGRVVHSYYSIMGIKNPPEADSLENYAELAVKLANDTEYHHDLSEQILANNDKLFEKADYGEKVVQLMKDIINQDLEKYRR